MTKDVDVDAGFRSAAALEIQFGSPTPDPHKARINRLGDNHTADSYISTHFGGHEPRSRSDSKALLPHLSPEAESTLRFYYGSPDGPVEPA